MHQTHLSTRQSWKTRGLSLVLALALTLGLVPGLDLGGGGSAHWADPYLSQLVEWGFIRSDQSQAPDKELTRADFMAITNRAYGYHETGPTPFEDIKESDWFYDDVGIAYTAKFIKGTSPTTASPDDTLTRETAATILGRNMMLQESAGEILDFTDARDISSWSKGVIKSSLEHYLVSGYDDGTFRPQRSVSWGEMAAMVTRIVGTPLQEPGDYALGGVYGNVTITSPGVTLRDTVVSGDLYVTGGVGLGDIKLENVTVLGRVICSGTGEAEGGQASIILRNVTADELLIDNLQGKTVSVQADGITEIGKTTVRTSAYVEDNTPEGLGLHSISLEGRIPDEGDDAEPASLTLAGRIEEVVNKTPDSFVHVGKGTVAKLTIDEAAAGSHVTIDRNAEVKELNLDTATLVDGDGDIKHLNVNAPGCEVTILPEQITIRPGITAEINGEEMDTTAAEESSSEPQILSGYPRVEDIAPTTVSAVFATNKKGTVYWAISPVTDGSVGAEELLKPLVYGSIAVAHGSVKTSKAEEEVKAAVTKLTPGGSYYLSAVMVDERGVQSPVKVVSFSTPDNTIPAFTEGHPYWSLIEGHRVQLTAMTTKDCNLYYALMPKGAKAPTEAEFKASAISGALGFGVRPMTKNIADVFWANDQTLEELTTYDLYLWLVDADGSNKSPITKLSVTTVDETPPIFNTDPTVTKVEKTSVGLTFQLNENGTVYWVAVPAGSNFPKPNPSTGATTIELSDPYAILQVFSGMVTVAGAKTGNVKATKDTNGTINVTGLEAEKAYDFYYVAKDNAGPNKNFSVTVKKITINTLDTNGPKVSQFFSKHAGTSNTENPMANTDIYLDFTENIRYSDPDIGGRGFLELYEDVVAARRTNSQSEIKRTVERLAQNLAATIKLHKRNISDNSEEPVTSRTTLDQTFTDSMTVDYTQATVTKVDDAIRVTFPDAGLHLENGGQYYFEITSLTDTSNNYNSVVPSTIDFANNQAASAAAGHSVPIFLVEFASVNISEPGVGAGDAPFTRNSFPSGDGKIVTPAAGEEQTYSRVDLSFRLTPIATSSVSKSVSYDVLLWTDVICTYDLFYRVIDVNGTPVTDVSKEENKQYEQNLLPRAKDKVTEVDGNGWIYLGNSGAVNPVAGQRGGRSINKAFNGCDSVSFPALPNLSDDLRYEFVITLKTLGLSNDWQNWNANVHFYVNVAAGQSNNLDNLAGTNGAVTTSNWTDAKGKGLNGGARSIGVPATPAEGEPDTQELSRRFTDSRLPEFISGVPSFEDVTSTSLKMYLTLTSPGYVYYVIGKAETGTGSNKLPEVTTTRKIIPEKDENVSGTTLARVPNSQDMMYVTTTGPNPPPPDGSVTMPDWMIGKGGSSPAADLPEGENLIDLPKPLYIFSPSTSNDTAGIEHTGSYHSAGNRREFVEVTGLEPDTTYFAYMVIKGEADPLSHVYIYQFTTQRASKPKITLGGWGTGTTGGATISTDIASKLRYMVFSYDDAQAISVLKQPFSGVVDSRYKLPDYYTQSGTFTVLDALLTPYRDTQASSVGNPELPRDNNNSTSSFNGFSVFDVFASEKIKSDMSDYLRGFYTPDFIKTDEAGRRIEIVDRSDSDLSLKAGEVKQEPLNIYRGTDFVILAVAQVPNPEAGTDNWQIDSYAAYMPINLDNAAPPEVQESGVSVVMSEVGTGTYSGLITIPFDKLLYNSSKALYTSASIRTVGTWYPNGLLSRVSAAIDNTSGRTVLTLDANSWKQSDHIEFTGGLFYNAQAIPQMDKRLTIDIINWAGGAPAGPAGPYVRIVWGDSTKYYPINAKAAGDIPVALTGNKLVGNVNSGYEITLDSSSGSGALEVKATPEELNLNSEEYTVTWSSENTAIATVAWTGGKVGQPGLTNTVRPVSIGTTNINVKVHEIATGREGTQVIRVTVTGTATLEKVEGGVTLNQSATSANRYSITLEAVEGESVGDGGRIVLEVKINKENPASPIQANWAPSSGSGTYFTVTPVAATHNQRVTIAVANNAPTGTSPQQTVTITMPGVENTIIIDVTVKKTAVTATGYLGTTGPINPRPF